MKRLVSITGIAIALVFVVPVAANADEGFRVPAGYGVAARDRIGPGLIHVTLASSRPAQRVHVAVLDPQSPLRLKAVLSNDAVAEPGDRLERTSRMCVRVRCLVAVNADFFADGEPVGGLVAGGALVRASNPRHHQLMVDDDGRPSAGTFSWKATLVPTDLEPLKIDALNDDRPGGRVVLYTPEYGPSTNTNDYGVEVALEVLQPAGRLRSGRTALVRLASIRESAGNSDIPANGAVLSGHDAGAQRLRDLWARTHDGRSSDTALLRIETTPALAESVGGTPILVRDGARWFSDPGTSLYRLRHPRTMAGWTRDGRVLLVTVDGRQPGTASGMTMTEAADFMIALGAVEAINLDGGGSSTFVVRGAVANRPSDRSVRRGASIAVVSRPRPSDTVLSFVERPVSVALAVVSPSTRFLDGPPVAGALDLAPGVLPSDADPASGLAGAGIVATVPAPGFDAGVLLFAALAVSLPVVRRLAFSRR